MLLSAAVPLYENYCLNNRRLSDRTVAYRVRELKWLADFMGDCDCNEVKRPDIERYFGHLAHNRGIGSQVNLMATVVSFFDFLEGEIEAVTRSPASHVTYPRYNRPLPRIVDESEAIQLCRTPGHETPKAVRDSAIISLLYGSGIRNSELTGLMVKDVSLRKNTLYVLHGKNNQAGYSFFPEFVALELQMYLTRARSVLLAGRMDPGWLFLSIHGKRLTRAEVRRVVKQAGEKCGLGWVHPHTMRHSFATHMVQADVDCAYVQKALRHRSLQSTGIYLHIANRKVHDKVMTMHPLANVTDRDIAVRQAAQIVDRGARF